MSLNEDIKNMQREMMANVPEEALKVMMAATEKLIKSGIAARALKTGDKAPAFSLPDTKGDLVSSEKLLLEGSLVINFYRGAWCPYCALELKAFDNSMEEIRRLGANLISISPNLQKVSAKFADENPFSFDILSDEGAHVSRQFGLLFTMAEELRPIYENFGIDITEYDGNDRYELPIPATYVVGSDGIITHSFVDADYTRRMEPTDIVEALKKIKSST